MDHNNGKYMVTYSCPRSNSAHHLEINITVNGLPLLASPFTVQIEQQPQRQSWRRVLTYGVEGNALGEFCRPWGVAIVPHPFNPSIVQGNSKKMATPNSASLQDAASSLSSSTDAHSKKEYLMAVADRSNNRIQLMKVTIGNNVNQR